MISIATNEDITALESLLNSAYRGEISTLGWTSEAHIIKGERRTDIPSLILLMDDPLTDFLKYQSENNVLTGCVCLQQKKEGIYLGMLSVSPLQQNAGIGKQLLEAATQYAQSKNSPRIFMTVISVRQELINWYLRHGYRETGERAPFPADHRFGIPLEPLEFVFLEKLIQ